MLMAYRLKAQGGANVWREYVGAKKALGVTHGVKLYMVMLYFTWRGARSW